MLNTIFQKKNFSTILIIILLALFLVVAFMRYVKVNEGLSVGADDITVDSTKKPNEEKQIIQVIDVLG
jgi:hypothetical protein